MRKVIFAWMVFLAIITVMPFFADPLPLGPMSIRSFDLMREVASTSVSLKIVWVLFGLFSIGICYGVVKLSGLRVMRNFVVRSFGLLFLFAGTFIVGLGIAERIVTPSVRKARNAPLGEIDPGGILTMFILGTAMLIGSYFLTFRKKGKNR